MRKEGINITFSCIVDENTAKEIECGSNSIRALRKEVEDREENALFKEVAERLSSKIAGYMPHDKVINDTNSDTIDD